VLSIGKLSLGQEAYYLEEVLDGAEDYYLHVGEAPGRWLGAGAANLGLEGTVTADQLRAVLAGDDPSSGSALRATKASLPGLDLTLSAPKSVSLVWGLGDPDTADAVVAAHEKAVDAALTYLERHACIVRRGHAGAELIEAGGFVAAGFRHRTSRLGDPALHTHVLVANLAEGTDGRWTALDTRQLYRHGRTSGFVYQAALRYELANRLGLLFEDVAQGHAEVAGVPEPLRREFSGRRRQIVEAMERHGATSARGAQAATLDTRSAKTEHVPEPELRSRWAERAETFDFRVDDLPRMPRTPTVDVTDKEVGDRVTEQHATFERRDVVRVVAQAATQGAALDDVERRTDDFLESSSAVTIAEGRWTTPEMLALERQAVDLALAGRSIGRAVVSETAVQRSLDERPSLGADQRRAVQAITTSGHAVDVLVGPAGTGKTFCLDAAREAWQADGRHVVGATLAARAAGELQAGSGITSQTADRLLHGLAAGRQQLDERTVIVIDEAAMLGTRRLSALLAEADAANAKIVLVGDAKQLPEIDAGGLFASLAHRLGHSELTRNRRQRDPQEIAAAHELRTGRVEQAMARLERHGHVTTADNADLLRDGLVGDWLTARRDGDQVVMVAARRATVADLNERARLARCEQGELGPPVMQVDDIEFSVGDEVIGHHNDYSLGILNGDRGVVRDGNDDGLVVDLDSGRCVFVPGTYIEEGNMTHGYALTVHKAQGSTYDRALVLGDDSYTIELGYTSLTRGRDRNQLYLVAPTRDDEHGPSLDRDPVAEFTEALHHSGAKTAAIDLIDTMEVGR
jgi:conjugative relaxase-like TrwC/TraI family protein